LQLYGTKHLEGRTTSHILELLAQQSQEGKRVILDYRTYMSAFDQGAPYFYSNNQTAKRSTDELEELARLRAEIVSLQNSASWRITAPLRLMGRWIKARRALGTRGRACNSL
jgi:hypothetical protein